MAFTSDRGMGCTAYMVRSASNTLHQVGYRRITGGLQVGDRRFTGGLQAAADGLQAVCKQHNAAAGGLLSIKLGSEHKTPKCKTAVDGQ